MAKGPRITLEVESLITGAYLEHPEWRAKEIQSEVNTRLRKENPRVNPDWPGISAVQKALTNIRKNEAQLPPEEKELDQPWSIGTLVKHPIPPECLPAVLRAFYAERRTDVKTDEYFRIGYEFGHKTYLTIREALWIARLSVLFKYPSLAVSASPKEDVAQYARFNLVTAQLVYWARLYALEEQKAEILQKPVDTSDFDIGFYMYARDEIYRTLVSVPSLIKFSWGKTRNHLKKEAQNERPHTQTG